MQSYNLKKMIKRATDGSIILLPGIEDSAASRKAYLKTLRSMLRQIASAGRKAKSGFDFEQLSSMATHLAMIAESMVGRVLRLESRRHTNTFKASVKRAVGVDLSEVVRLEDLEEYLRLASLRNAGLIKNLGADAVKRVQETVTTAVIEGASSRDLQARLTEQLRISDRRAQLIATDQMAKLNADLNRIRHEQAGIIEYKWMTSRDERVRPLHRRLDGKVYKYGQNTGAENGLPPGQPVRCRCIARAIVQF